MANLRTTTLIGLACCMIAATPALAQKPPETTGPAPQNAEPPSPSADPKVCADSKRQTVGRSDVVEEQKPDPSLQQKLARSGGVICPPAEVDPDAARGPSPGAAPVVRPPGNPTLP